MKLTLETAKEMYKSDIPSIKQFALDNYNEEELKQLQFPKTWEDLGCVSGEYIDEESDLKNLFSITSNVFYRNIIPKGLGQSVLDLIQLLQVRDRYREIEGYKPIDDYGFNAIFSFSKAETTKLFVNNFKEKIKSVDKLYE